MQRSFKSVGILALAALDGDIKILVNIIRTIAASLGVEIYFQCRIRECKR